LYSIPEATELKKNAILSQQSGCIKFSSQYSISYTILYRPIHFHQQQHGGNHTTQAEAMQFRCGQDLLMAFSSENKNALSIVGHLQSDHTQSVYMDVSTTKYTVS
jgi:hypothetical protein